MKNVLIISSEGVPFAKSGGLGDVIGALPKELKAQGVNVRVILPLYKTVKDTYGDQLKFIESYAVGLSWRMEHCGLFETEYEGVTFYFMVAPGHDGHKLSIKAQIRILWANGIVEGKPIYGVRINESTSKEVL